MRDRKPIPVIIIGGFLGAGKTTLLNYILSENHGIRAGVLVNDFGAINIDAKLVVGVDGDTVSLANGCVCCSIRDDLIPACMVLVQRENPPELLIVETSGVSEPMQVAHTFMMPEIEATMALETILTIVDTEQFPELIKSRMAPLTRLQVREADMIVLNKVDLVDINELKTTRSLVHEIAPGARILEAEHGKVSLGLIMGSGLNTASSVLREDPSPNQMVHLHDFPFTTYHWTSDKPLSLVRLRSALEALPDTIYRLKGIAYLEELPSHRVVLQMVGRRYNIGDTEPWGKQPPRTEIVMIASLNGLDSNMLQQSFDNCIGTGDESVSPILRLTRFLEIDTERKNKDCESDKNIGNKERRTWKR